jgi:hypothetical protein
MKIRWLPILGMVIGCLPVSIAGQKQVSGAGGYRISGTAVNSVTGAPLGQVHIVAARDDGAAGQLDTTTGADGKFAIEPVPAGSWSLTAERKGYLRQVYGQRDLNKGINSSVITGPKGASENLVLPMHQPAAISGKVVDERGEPVPGAIIHLLVQTISSRKQVMIRKVVATDDQGDYRLFDLPPTTCYLSAVVPNPMGVISETAGFVPQYYPNTADARSAAPIQLKPGAEFVANFALRRARGGVSVTVDGDTKVEGGNGSQLLVLVTEGPEGSSVSAATLGPGQGTTFSHIQPGRYKLVVGDVESINTLAEWVEVGSQDVTVTLPMADPPEISATVRVVDGDPASLRGATLALASFSDVVNSMRPILPDGSVKIAPMPSGRYEIVLGSAQLYVKSVTARTARMVDGMVELPESGAVRLDIVAAGDGASVSGVVTAARGPLSGALVVLIPRKQPGDPTDNHGYQADSDGSFKFPSIKPGEYYLFATDDWQLEWGDPTKVKPYLALAKVVKADPRGTLETQIEVSRRP